MLAGALIPGVLGVALERTVYQRMYGRPHVSAFLGMFALMLVMQGAAQQIWGVAPVPVDTPPQLSHGSIEILGVNVPAYYPVVIAVAVLALAGSGAIIFRTNLGLWTRAIAADRAMAAVLGRDVGRTFSVMFGLGCVLAGIAGVLIAPLQQVDSSLGTLYIIQAFAVVLIGGLGSLRGALVAALALGLVEAFFAIDVPPLSGYGIYLAMIVALIFRPNGLFHTANAGLSTEQI